MSDTAPQPRRLSPPICSQTATAAFHLRVARDDPHAWVAHAQIITTATYCGAAINSSIGASWGLYLCCSQRGCRLRIHAHSSTLNFSVVYSSCAARCRTPFTTQHTQRATPHPKPQRKWLPISNQYHYGRRNNQRFYADTRGRIEAGTTYLLWSYSCSTHWQRTLGGVVDMEVCPLSRYSPQCTTAAAVLGSM